jgi:aryl-alcohol dehydrogenase-like predicted oxidoreductase
MEYTTLGRTGLKVSVAGLGCGGFSRLGLPAGKSEDEAALLVREAVDMGINFIDTAPIYGTEATVGKALKHIPRHSVAVATKASIRRDGEWHTPAQVIASLENSLRVLGTNYVDVFQLHGVLHSEYAYARESIVPALLEQKAKGRIRFLGITEQPPKDYLHEMLCRAAQDDVWDVFMIAFHMMHQSARRTVFPLSREKRIGTLLMFAVRSIFASPERVAIAMREAAAKGQVEKHLGEAAEPLAFLIHENGASTITEAAYRFARHEPGVDVVLFGTGDAGHLRANIGSLLKPPLPEADRKKLVALFAHLMGVGMDAPRMQPIHQTAP